MREIVLQIPVAIKIRGLFTAHKLLKNSDIVNLDITIEPMINQGRKEIRFASDGWTTLTKDRKLSA